MDHLGTIPASEPPFRAMVAALALQASMTCDGKLSPQAHADIAVQAADALIERLERAGGAS